MMNLYIQTNLLVAGAWIVFQLLPQKRFRYRASKKIAQILLLSSLSAIPLLSLLPDLSFPDFSTRVDLGNAQNVDAETGTVSPMRQVLQQVTSATDVVPQQSPFPSQLWTWIFLVGMGAMGGRHLWGGYQLSKLLRASLTLHQIGRASVVLSDAIAVPFSTLHFGRAYVVLPSELVPYRGDFRIALRHEVEHHRRRDTFWALFLEWLICAFYLNPAIYLWRKTILQLQELACDEALISRMGISKHAYGSCLLRVAEMALGRRFMCAGTTCMIPTSETKSHSFLTRRIKVFAQHENSMAKRAAGVLFGTASVFTILATAYFAQAAVRSKSLPNPGQAIYDSRIQPLAEEALRKGMAAHKASAGFAIVADPVRGTVIAAVSVNSGFDKRLKGDWALSYPLEPGSVLKPLIVASALQRKLTKVDEMHNCENGEYRLGSMLNHDSEPFAALSTADTVAQSSNICTIKIGQKMGAKGIENVFREFGVGGGEVLQDFPAARAGHVPEAGGIPDDDYIALVSQGIPHRTGFYVTALEMVQAYGAIVNGGRLMKAIPADAKVSPEMIRDVLTPEVAAQMRGILQRVVEEGTARSIKDSSIPLAGKTSTVVINGNQRVTGFIGYAPADRPKLVVYVVLFDPKGKGKFGSSTAAPVFREIIEKAVPIFNP